MSPIKRQTRYFIHFIIIYLPRSVAVECSSERIEKWLSIKCKMFYGYSYKKEVEIYLRGSPMYSIYILSLPIVVQRRQHTAVAL